MPLSYCSIAWAIQPTVRPMMKSPSAAFCGSPNPVAAAARAKSTLGCRPVRRSPARPPLRSAAGFGAMRARPLEDRRGARVALRDRENGQTRADLRRAPNGRPSPPSDRRRGRSRQTAPRRGPSRRRDGGPDNALSAADDHGIRGGAGRGDAARDKGRGVELVIGDQHEAAAQNVGARLVQSPRRGEPAVDRLGAGRCGRRRRRRARREFAGRCGSPRPRVRSSAGRSSSASAASRIWQRSISPDAGVRRPDVAGRSMSAARRLGSGAPEQAVAISSSVAVSERRTASCPAVIEAAVLDQADRRADHRHQRFGIGAAAPVLTGRGCRAAPRRPRPGNAARGCPGR